MIVLATYMTASYVYVSVQLLIVNVILRLECNKLVGSSYMCCKFFMFVYSHVA